ncbi:MAG: magnesium transporter [Candidatus Eisenbacteria bacterium]|nr:CBS domain-containing protein [Candidatus Eisenbacteria bacterium]
MSHSSGFAFVFVSEILGRRVRGPEGRRIGRVVDLIATSGEMYPVVRAIVIRSGRGPRLAAPVPIPAMRDSRSRKSAIHLGTRELVIPQLEPNDFLVRELLLDKQIVDVQGAKVERVNDVHLLVTDRVWIVHVDVGFSGLLRRMGVERAARPIWKAVGRPEPEDLISWKFVQPLADPSSVGEPLRLRVEQARIRDLHPGEVADILEELDRNERVAILHSLGPEAAADALEEVEEEMQASIIAQLDPEVAADILEEMDPSEAADILTNLPDAQSEEIIAEVEAPERAQLEQLIEYEEKTAASLMTPEFVSVGPTATVAEAMEEVRRMAPEIEGIYYVYVLDPEHRLLGVTTLRTLLRAQAADKVADIMERRLVTVGPDEHRREVAEVFQKYSFLGCPVVDEEMRMIGVVLIKHAFDELLPDFRREGRA